MMSTISLPRFLDDRDHPAFRFFRVEAMSRPSPAANFGTDWAFNEQYDEGSADSDRDLGFVSDWALPSTSDTTAAGRPPR